MLTEGRVRLIAAHVAAALIKQTIPGTTSEQIKGVVENVIRQMNESGELSGKTPIKGTDYWTDEDKAAMVSDVLAALPASEEVAV